MKKISIVIADKHPIVRRGFQQLLTQVNDIELVGEAGDGETAQRLCKENQPTVLLLDVSLPGPSAIDTVAFVQKNCPHTKVLIFTSDFDVCQMRCLVEMGIAGSLLKTEVSQNLLEAIRTLGEGQTWFSQSMMKALWAKESTSSETEATSLTEDELEILQLMASEKTDEQIAKCLHVSSRTVRNYSGNLYDKLSVSTRTGAVAEGFRRGLIE
jgi:DNA-binding NarL/FixJ family response regulator